jgi:hypothetical protein
MVRSEASLDGVLEVLTDAHALAGDLTQFAVRCEDERVRSECDALKHRLDGFEEVLRLYGLRIYAGGARNR